MKNMFVFATKVIQPLVFFIAVSVSQTAFGQDHPISWWELQDFQADSLIPESELELVTCTESLMQEENLKHEYYHMFLYANYAWREYEDETGALCVVLLLPDVGPLTPTEARVLLSASEGLGFHEKGLYEQAQQMNDIVGAHLACEDPSRSIPPDDHPGTVSDGSYAEELPLMEIDEYPPEFVPDGDSSHGSISVYEGNIAEAWWEGFEHIPQRMIELFELVSQPMAHCDDSAGTEPSQ